MASKMLLFSTFFAVVALLSAEPLDYNIVCIRDKTVIESVLNCTSLMPSVDLEIIRECNSRIRNVEEDARETFLDILCIQPPEENEDLGKVYECTEETFKTRGIDGNEDIEPTIECLEKLTPKHRLAEST